MAVRIIVDSASDLEDSFIREHDIILVPMTTTFQDGEYKEGVNLTREEFFVKLSECDELPHTSQVPPADFRCVFERVVAAGDTAVAITLSAKLSGTYNCALAAAEGMREAIFVVDSMNASLGELVVAKRAVALRDEGRSAREIAAIIDAEKAHVRVFALLDTLEYLKKGGRISSAMALAGGLLSIKPIVGVESGEVALYAKARGFKRGMHMLRELIAKEGIDFSRPVRLGFSGFADGVLQKFIEESHDVFDGMKNKIDSGIIGATIGTHVGPGAIGAAFFSLRSQQV